MDNHISKNKALFIVPQRTLETFTIARMLKKAGYREGENLFLTNADCQSGWDDLETGIRTSVQYLGFTDTPPDVYGIELAPDYEHRYTSLSHITNTGLDAYKVFKLNCQSTIVRVANLIGHTLTPMEALISVKAKAGDDAMRRYAEDRNLDIHSCDAIHNLEAFIDRGQQVIQAQNIRKITLLTSDEYKKAKKKGYVKNISEYWWLRTPSKFLALYIMCVIPSGSVTAYGVAANDPKIAVRPVLQFKPDTVGIYPGNSFSFGGHRWTVIGDNTALCDDAIAYRPFDKDVFRFVRICKYDKADIKQFLEEWLAKKIDSIRESRKGALL